MPAQLECSTLHVEGPDDKHVIAHLLVLHGIKVNLDDVPLIPEAPRISPTDGLNNLLDGIGLAVRLSTGRAVGFVLDADSPLGDRWLAVQRRLAEVDVKAPPDPPQEGFIGKSTKFEASVGVWLMPDNKHDGMLETFLRELIADEDTLIDHATSATDNARELGARFSSSHHTKAIVHAWLAWQEDPGLRYGQAISRRYFGHESPAALAFVAWFKKLYQIEI